MALTEYTLDELVQRTCMLHLHDWHAGIATGGSTSTIVDATNRNERDDYWNNLPYAEVYIRTTTDSAAPIRETRKISDFVSSTGTISLSDNWSAVTAAGDTYSIHTDFPRAEVVEAINASIDEATRLGCLVEKIDETIQLVAYVYEYAVPDGFTHIYKINMDDTDAGSFAEATIDPTQYRIMRGGTPKIKFLVTPPSVSGGGVWYGGTWAESVLIADRYLRIEGYGRQANLTLGTDVCKISPGFICPMAASILQASRIKRQDLEPDAHSTQYAIQNKMAMNALSIARTRFSPDTKKVEI